MAGYLSLLLLFLSTYLFTLRSRPKGVTDFCITFFILSIAQLILSANILSYFELLNSVNSWLISGLFFLLISSALTAYTGNVSLKPPFWNQSRRVLFHPDSFRKLSAVEKLIFISLGGALTITALMNLFLVFNLAPGNHDSMTSHLVRVAYYLQYGSYDFFDANSWGHVVHPRNSTSLFLYSYLVTGNENMTQLVQFISYWITLLSVYGITALSGMGRKAALLSACVAGLLTSILMQATTTQSDLILTAMVGSIVYHLLAFKVSGNQRFLVMAILTVSMAMGVKASVLLALIPAAMIGVYSIIGEPIKKQIKIYTHAAGFLLLFTVMFTLTSGYLFNINKFGHPLGPDYVRSEHTFESESAGYIAKNGVRNSVRYGVEFISLDGFPTITPIRKIQMALRGYSRNELDQFVNHPESNIISADSTTSGSNRVTYTGQNPFIHYLMDAEASRNQFNYFKMPATDEDFSYWGILGFGLIWITFIYSIFAADAPKTLKVLALSAVVFFLLQAFSGPFDPWRGRYFNIAVIFMAPSVGLFLRSNFKLLRVYLLLMIIIGSVSAVSAVILKSGGFYPIESAENDTGITYTFNFHFQQERLYQLTRRGTAYGPIKAFEENVPKDANVAVFLHDGVSYEYPLFGENFSRTLYPINPFDKGVQPVPDEADYLVYYYDYPDADFTNDILLGNLFGNPLYLRPLN